MAGIMRMTRMIDARQKANENTGNLEIDKNDRCQAGGWEGMAGIVRMTRMIDTWQEGMKKM
jgi:hypothetical protein